MILRNFSKFFNSICLQKLLYTTKKITMSKNINVFQTLLYTKETSIYNFAHKVLDKFLCASGAETRFSVTAESNGMLCIPLQLRVTECCVFRYRGI